MPDLNLRRSKENAPPWSQCQVRDDSRAMLHEMMNMERLEELWVLRQSFAAPDIPTACSLFWWMAQRVERCKAQCLNGDANC